MAPPPPPAPRSLLRDGRRFYRLLAAVAVGSLLLGLTNYWLTVLTLDPSIRRGTLLARGITDAHVALLDQGNGLRAYAATGREDFLADYRDGQDRHAEAMARAWSHSPTGEQRRLLLQTQRRASAWQTDYAVPLIVQVARTRPLAPDSPEWARAQAEFASYATPYAQLLTATRQANLSLMRRREVLDVAMSVLQVLAATSALGFGLVRRRRLVEDLGRPVEEMSQVLDALAAGKVGVRPATYGTTEFAGLAERITGLADAAEQREADERARQDSVRRRADVYETVLYIANDLADYLEQDELADALVRALHERVGVDVAVLQRLEDGVVSDVLAARPVDAAPPDDQVSRDAVRFLRLAVSADGRSAALPVVHGGRAYALLRVHREEGLAEETVLAVRQLALAAGGALTAAGLHQQVRDESRTDALTGLHNRRRFEEDLEHELALSGRSGVPLSLVMVDIDHFKRFNDTRGHREGDRLLSDLGGVLRTTLRSTDSAYRYGGEEIALLARGTGPVDAELFAERVRQAVQSRTPVTVSIGVATTTTDVASDLMVVTADRALYAAKDGGRNTVRVSEALLTVELPSPR